MELKYPVQPFVFEFSKKANKNISFKDIHIKQPAGVDMSPVQRYLDENGSLLDELAGFGSAGQDPLMVSIQNCVVSDVFFDAKFDLRRASIFEKVFYDGCLKQRMYGESLVLQLDTVQSLLYHASDSKAYEFFKSFSIIHDMNHELSVLLPEIRKTRSNLKCLDDENKSIIAVSTLCKKKERMEKTANLMNSMKKIVSSQGMVEILVKHEDFEGAFSFVEEMINLLMNNLLGIKVLRGHLQKLRNLKIYVEKKTKEAFYNTFFNENRTNDILKILNNHDLINSSVNEIGDFIKDYAAQSVNQLLKDAAVQKGYDEEKIGILSIKEFNDVMSIAFPNIRTKILIKGNDCIERVSNDLKEIGVDETNLLNSSNTLADNVFREVIKLVLQHPLKGASLDDFGAMFESLISFSRGFEKFEMNKNFINQSLLSLGRSFLENFHCEQIMRLSQSLANEKWLKKAPEQIHIEIIKKLTNTDVNDLIIKDEEYGATTTSLTLIEITWNYLQVARRVPKTADDVIKKLTETIKLFNSQCHDLLIKGGSIQTVKKKAISTKNLALGAAGLDFIVKLIPFLKPRLIVVGATQDIIEKQFAEVVKLLTQNYQTLLNKILEVLGRLIQKHCDQAEFDQTQISPYIVSISNEVLKLYKIIIDCLPHGIITTIMNNIGQHISANLLKLLKLNGQRIEKLMNRDVDYLNEQFKQCKIEINLLYVK